LAGLAENTARVLRGGSYNNEDRNLRCAIRNDNNPNNRNDNIGFRVVVRVVSHASLWKAHGFCPWLRPEMPFIHG
jgi:hypothetical protein